MKVECVSKIYVLYLTQNIVQITGTNIVSHSVVVFVN